MAKPKVYPPSWCYPSSMEFECEACGALPEQTCDQADLYGPTVLVAGGHLVHKRRALTRKDEVIARVAAWKAEHGID